VVAVSCSVFSSSCAAGSVEDHVLHGPGEHIRRAWPATREPRRLAAGVGVTARAPTLSLSETPGRQANWRAGDLASPGLGELSRGPGQVRLRLVPGLAVRHAPELLGQGRAAPRLDELADRQIIDGQCRRPAASHRPGRRAAGRSARVIGPPADAGRPPGPGTRASASAAASPGTMCGSATTPTRPSMNPFAHATAVRIPATRSLPVISRAASVLTRSRMLVLSSTSQTCGGWGVEHLFHLVADQLPPGSRSARCPPHSAP
jgi:hypothetical protein